MAEATDVGFVFQCVLCGSFAIFAIDALQPTEVAMQASGIAASHGQKVLQKDVHAAEEQILESIQQRLCRSPPADAQSNIYVLLPCATCLEIETERPFSAYLDGAECLEKPTPLLPQLPVVFEAGERPPAYVWKAGKWILALGLGPKDLDMRLPNQLPAGQFRVVLPPESPPLRSPIQAKGGKSHKGGKAKDEDEEPAVWETRRGLISAMALLITAPAPETGVEKGSSAVPKPARALGARAPPVGAEYPWITEFLALAQRAFSKSKATESAAYPRYILVPLLRVADVVLSLAEQKVMELGLCYS